MLRIINEIIQERKRQDEKWGEQNHPFTDPILKGRESMRLCEEYEIPTEGRAKQLTNINSRRGSVTWGHIIVEELSEAISAQDSIKIREELVQLAAVCIAAIESLERNEMGQENENSQEI